MQSFEATIQAAIAARDIPGATVIARSVDGSYNYAQSFGVSSLKDDGNHHHLQLDTLFWLGSCTKLMTVVATLQCVERGYFTLDEDVTRLLPELSSLEVKRPSSGEGGTVTTGKRTKTITLRHLLTHTSGLSYTRFGALHLPLMERCLAPLDFEPGEGFIYGTGVDFAGFMVERVSDLSLEEYIHLHIAAPLGIGSICFRPPEKQDLHRRLAAVSFRKDNAGPVEWAPETIWPLDTVGDSGGSGAYAAVVDYQKIMHSIASNDHVLLSDRMVDELFRPDMSEIVRVGVMKTLEDPTRNNIYGGLPKGTQATYAIGGMVVLEDLPERRPKGTLHWGGLLNVFFWMDRKNGISGIYGSQVFPAGDPTCLGLLAEFERKTYEEFRVLSDGS